MPQVQEPVMNVLSAATIEGAVMKLHGDLDRTLYAAVNKVIEAAGGKWDRRQRAHIFDGDAYEAMEPILLSGEYACPKQDFGQFDTPNWLAADVVKTAGLMPGMDVLEPSAGIGNLAVAAIKEGAVVTAVELDPKRAVTLCKRVAIMATGFSSAFTGIHTDFLSLTPRDKIGNFDRIVMNPPFSKQADIEHVYHAHRFLRPAGLLVSIMSASVMHRNNARSQNFRSFVEERGGDFSPLPEKAFAESGTMVRTCLVTIPA